MNSGVILPLPRHIAVGRCLTEMLVSDLNVLLASQAFQSIAGVVATQPKPTLQRGNSLKNDKGNEGNQQHIRQSVARNEQQCRKKDCPHKPRGSREWQAKEVLFESLLSQKVGLCQGVVEVQRAHR